MVTLVNAKYQTGLQIPEGTDPLIAQVRVNPLAETLSIEGVLNAVPAAASNSQIPIRVSSSRRYGITARHIVLVRVVGEPGFTYRTYRRVVVFDPAYFEASLSTSAPDVAYEGFTDWLLVGGSQERYHLLFGAGT
jgi:hypothetical protein